MTGSMHEPMPGSERVRAARRIVVKVGTTVILRDNGRPALARLHQLVESIATLRGEGRELILVSSGAVRLGAERIRCAGEEGETLRVPAVKRSCAAIGQSQLMQLYAEACTWAGLTAAQLLVTDEQFSHPNRVQALRATLDALLASGAVPILNENDAVHGSDLRGAEGSGHADGADRGDREAQPPSSPIIRDNDMLAALLAGHIGADLLVLLSNVDGLYTSHPARPHAVLIPSVPAITKEILAVADGGNPWGRGGMAGKLAAAQHATSLGVRVVIANGCTPHVLERLCAGEALGTEFASVQFAPAATVHLPHAGTVSI